jgi:nitrogen fixation protein NifU and related proteins
MDLKALYRDIILDHYKKPRNTGALGHPTVEARCKNPACGDRVLLQLEVEDGRVAAVGLQGTGCAVSQASASMMTEAVKGASLEDARAKLHEFRRMVVDGVDEAQLDKQVLGDLLTLQGVAKLHARVKCALCGWSALEAALDQRGDEVDLELDKSLPDAKAGGM